MAGVLYTSLTESVSRNNRNDFIREYFHAGFTYHEILTVLSEKHAEDLSIRQLHRILRTMGLRRRDCVDVTGVVNAVQREVSTGGCTLGYRSMKQRLLSSHGINAPRSLILVIQRQIDPVGVDARRRHRLTRRTYINKGPNFLVHVDGYDKLKRYGFAIHAGICGYSRRLLWLRVTDTNNNPKVVASYFLDYISDIQGVPRCVRIDAGTENVLIEDIQKSFRWDHTDDMSGAKSVIIGPSPANQRIERWWRSLRHGGCEYWIKLFKDLEATGMYSAYEEAHRNCLRFAFMELIRMDLMKIMVEWNQHHIRTSRSTETRGGKPDLLYFLPRVYGTVDYKTTVDTSDIEAARYFCETPKVRGCDNQFEERCFQMMRRQNKVMPQTADEALFLYSWLTANLE